MANFIAYVLLTRIFSINYLTSNMLAWFSALVFSYYANRKFVFCCKVTDYVFILRQFGVFLLCRLATGTLELFILWFFVDILMFYDLFVKIISNIIVIILNYITSKVIIFSKIYITKDEN